MYRKVKKTNLVSSYPYTLSYSAEQAVRFARFGESIAGCRGNRYIVLIVVVIVIIVDDPARSATLQWRYDSCCSKGLLLWLLLSCYYL